MNRDYFLSKKSGFTLIEMLVFIFIFTVVSLAFYQTMVTGIQVALDSRNRLGALALANEKMEIARNLKYEDVGTIGGVPSGTLAENQDVSANGISYAVKTVVKYDDDVFDDYYPTDTIPNDYKVVEITVSWGSQTSPTKKVSLVSRFVPPGLEVVSGDGVLSVHIIDSTGAGVSQASLHIVNNSVSPPVDITQPTNGAGSLVLIGAKQSIQNYAITVSKTDYETIHTVDLGSVAYAPIDVHASVMTGLINTKSIVIDLVSDLTIKTVNQAETALPGVSFHLNGGRILGTDNSITPWKTIYTTDSDKTTDAAGESKLEDQGPGQFFVTDIEAPSGHTLVGVSPLILFDGAVPSYKFSLLPDSTKTVTIKFAQNDLPGLKVKVVDNLNALVNGATVKLSVVDGYEDSKDTSFDGIAFFTSNPDEPLVNGIYNLEVTAAGFQAYTEEVTIDNFTEQEVQLTAV